MSGCLATIEARQNAYPLRFEFWEFYEKFWESSSGDIYGEGATQAAPMQFRKAKAQFPMTKDSKEAMAKWRPLCQQVVTTFQNEFEEWKE